jgi:hypothetical protein
LILVALGRHPPSDAASAAQKTVTSLEQLREALHVLKADGLKPQARTD